MARLYFRYGAMNAGKSAALLQVVHNYKEKNMKGLIIKPKIDTKGDNKVVSRIGLFSPVDILLDIDESLFSIQNQQIIKDSNCIIVDMNYGLLLNNWIYQLYVMDLELTQRLIYLQVAKD